MDIAACVAGTAAEVPLSRITCKSLNHFTAKIYKLPKLVSSEASSRSFKVELLHAARQSSLPCLAPASNSRLSAVGHVASASRVEKAVVEVEPRKHMLYSLFLGRSC